MYDAYDRRIQEFVLEIAGDRTFMDLANMVHSAHQAAIAADVDLDNIVVEIRNGSPAGTPKGLVIPPSLVIQVRSPYQTPVRVRLDG